MYRTTRAVNEIFNIEISEVASEVTKEVEDLEAAFAEGIEAASEAVVVTVMAPEEETIEEEASEAEVAAEADLEIEREIISMTPSMSDTN